MIPFLIGLASWTAVQRIQADLPEETQSSATRFPPGPESAGLYFLGSRIGTRVAGKSFAVACQTSPQVMRRR